MIENKVLVKLRGSSPSFIAAADLHLGKKLYNMPELEEDTRDNLARLVDLAILKDVEYVVIAGDLFEDNLAKPHMIAFVAQQVKRLADAGIKIIGIAGDHDKPLKGESWYRISGITPVQTIPAFAGVDYFDYSTVEVENIVTLLKEGKDPNKIKWLVLHCQFPQLFDMSQPKKLIDFNRLDLFTNFPNLEGIIAGDIHFVTETKAYGVGVSAYVGYTGSLGNTDISEASRVHRVLYCDGNKLMAVPFPQRRKMIRINFRGREAEDFDVSTYIDTARAEEFKPVFHVTWDRNSEPHVHKLFPLYDVSLVQMHLVPVNSVIDSLATSADRTEVSTDTKIEKALRDCVVNDDKDENLIKMTLGLITSSEPKVLLDTFKKEFNL